MADKPPFRYLKVCNHAGHSAGKCRMKAKVGTEAPAGVEFKRKSSTGKATQA